MLTVNNRVGWGEEIYSGVERVSYAPPQSGNELTPPCGAALTLNTPGINGGSITLFCGDAYVMNENGKTIARYDLDLTAVPITG